MDRVRALVFLGLLGSAPVAMSQSVFNGTWRPNPQVFSPTRKPDVIELANGVYECRNCSPPYKVKVDGHDQTIEANPNFDTLSLTVVNDRTVSKIAKKSGKVVLEAKVLVSADVRPRQRCRRCTTWPRVRSNSRPIQRACQRDRKVPMPYPANGE